MTPEAHATIKFIVSSICFFDLIVQVSRLLLRRPASAMKPALAPRERGVKSIVFARPCRANVLLHLSALAAHAPVRSNAVALCGKIKREHNTAIANATYRVGIMDDPSLFNGTRTMSNRPVSLRELLDLDQQKNARVAQPMAK
ncbi:hypothetical protein ACSVBT_17210 [Afipia sp. TerB]